MKRKGLLPELLAPAGNMECLFAAVEAGADAVYVGGRSFGARAYAKNFDIEELSRAASYCRLHGVKLYVTVNTLVFDREMRELSDFAAELWRIGVSAVIVADIGAVREIRRRVPELEIHASTQMSVHNTDGAEAAASMGVSRVVLARELSFENISLVTEKCSVETEVFLHGALCVSHSGQCLMSSLVGGRSGNRGECAQPCRLPYCNKNLLSLRDLSLAGHITELISSGVASLKIEGRMKSPEYVYTVTKIYRRLLDGRRNADLSETAELERIFSRGGFTDGYFTDRKFSKMTGVRTDADKENTKAVSLNTPFEPLRVPVKAEAVMKCGEQSRLTLILGDRRVTEYGETPAPALNSPLTEESVKARLAKMGATLLSLSPEDISLTLDGGINLPPSAINSLRRRAASALEDCRREPTDTEFEPTGVFAAPKKLITAQFFSAEAYRELCAEYPQALKKIDVAFIPLEDFHGEARGVAVPPVLTDTELDLAEGLLKAAVGYGAEYALVGNIGHIALAKRAGLVPVGDFRLNITNRAAYAEYKDMGIEAAVLSPELTLPMARDIGGGEIIYGRIPLMLTERCFIKENFGCENCSSASLEDRTGARFPILREYGHRNLILNSLPTYMGDRKKELLAAGIKHLHFLFTVEGACEINGVLIAYEEGRPLDTDIRRIGKR